MGNSQYFDNLVACYLSNELSVEDTKWFLELVNSDEEKRLRFEEMKKVFGLTRIEESIEEIDIDSEWKKLSMQVFPFKPPVEIEDEPERKGFSLWKKLTVIGAVFFVLSFFAIRYMNEGSVEQSPKDFSANIEAQSSIAYQINTTGIIKYFELPDGSKVELYPQSWINFDREMMGNVRSVKLVGKALFQVAKDAKRPFTVYSGAISTTAIGTRFIVRSFESENNISVRLEEGKVVINTQIENIKKGKGYYLLPGDEFVYSKSLSKGNVKKYLAKEKSSINREDGKKLSPIENISIPFVDKNSNWFMFNNQSLPEVFEQLKEMYQVDIVYQKSKISKLYFIGAFRTTDPINVVLYKIAELNGLQVTQKDQKYYVKRIR